jgi:hypothetical protein
VAARITRVLSRRVMGATQVVLLPLREKVAAEG